MSKKKSQLDLAIEQMEADVIDLRRTYEAQRLGLEAAIDKLRRQKAGAPVRKRRAVAKAAEAQS